MLNRNFAVIVCFNNCLIFQEKEDETGMWEEMFHTHKDSKPNGMNGI